MLPHLWVPLDVFCKSGKRLGCGNPPALRFGTLSGDPEILSNLQPLQRTHRPERKGRYHYKRCKMILAVLVVLRATFVAGVPVEPIGSLSIAIAACAVDFGNLHPGDLAPPAINM